MTDEFEQVLDELISSHFTRDATKDALRARVVALYETMKTIAGEKALLASEQGALLREARERVAPNECGMVVVPANLIIELTNALEERGTERDATVIERESFRRVLDQVTAQRDTAHARIAKLEAALESIAENPTLDEIPNTAQVDETYDACVQRARAALAAHDTPEGK